VRARWRLPLAAKQRQSFVDGCGNSSSWRFGFRRHDQISTLIVEQHEPQEKLVKAALSACADVIETEFLVTNILALMLLAALVQVLAAR
jgi:hypothetical protein